MAQAMVEKTRTAIKNKKWHKPDKLVILAHDLDFRESIKKPGTNESAGHHTKLQEFIELMKGCDGLDVSFHTLENY